MGSLGIGQPIGPLSPAWAEIPRSWSIPTLCCLEVNHGGPTALPAVAALLVPEASGGLPHHTSCPALWLPWLWLVGLWRWCEILTHVAQQSSCGSECLEHGPGTWWEQGLLLMKSWGSGSWGTEPAAGTDLLTRVEAAGWALLCASLFSPIWEQHILPNFVRNCRPFIKPLSQHGDASWEGNKVGIIFSSTPKMLFSAL